MTQYIRQTAYLTNIATLLTGSFVKGEAQMQPSYVTTKQGKQISRTHLMGVIVALNDGSEATIDDGTGKIVVRSFENPSFFSDYQLGTIVRVIGKVRAFNEQVYLIPEIVKAIVDRNWVTHHKYMLERETVSTQTHPSIIEETIDADDIEPESPTDDVISIIKEKDIGEGVQIESVIAMYGEDAERIIQSLLETGEIFEIRPGRIKMLE